MDEVDAPNFDACLRRVRDLARASGLTQDELGAGVRRLHAIGAEQFREVLKGKRQPRGWHRLMRAVATVLAEEDARPLPPEAKAEAYLRRIYGLPSVPRYRLLDFAEWVGAGGSYTDLTRRLIALDRASLPGLTEATEGSLEQWTDLHAALPDCGQLLVADESTIAGYWFYVPLLPEAFASVRDGTLPDADLTVLEAGFPGLRGGYDVYLVVMTLRPDWRNTVTRHRLVEGLFDHFRARAELDLYVDRLCLCASSPESEALARSLGMRPGAEHASYRVEARDGCARPARMYEFTARDIASSPRIARHWPDLARAYARWCEDE